MGKSSGPSIKIGPMEKMQAEILKKTEAQLGEPLRNQVTPQILGAFGGSNPFSTTLPAVDRDVIESQYKQARSNILQTVPGRGGQMNQLMADLEGQRAFDVASAINTAKQRGQERGLAVLPAFLPGAQQLTNAVSGEQQRKSLNAQMKAQNQAGFGSGIGGLLGLGFGK